MYGSKFHGSFDAVANAAPKKASVTPIMNIASPTNLNSGFIALENTIITTPTIDADMKYFVMPSRSKLGRYTRSPLT